MITTIPINHVICPACLGGGLWLGNISIPCTHCDGEGLILNPLIADWERSESPAAMVERPDPGEALKMRDGRDAWRRG